MSKTIDYTPHAYALLLPPLTDEEYAGLKADIAEHGILYPVIVDEEDRVLDGVHRVRIASELGVNPPVSRHRGLSDERKLHLAVGLNMRRRHLDADRRQALVRKLHRDEQLSLRKIASITGWSKSTIDRDLKESPFEAVLTRIDGLKEKVAFMDSEIVRDIYSGINESFSGLFGWANGQWKQDNWPPANDEELLGFRLTLYTFEATQRWTAETLKAKATDQEVPPVPAGLKEWSERWAADADYRARLVEKAREQGLLARARAELSQMGHFPEEVRPG